MPVLLSAAFAAGVLLVFLSLTGGGRTRAGRPAVEPIGRLLRRSGGGEVGSRELGVVSGGTGIALAVVAQAALGWPVFTLAVGGAGVLLPSWYFRQRSVRRRAAIADAVAEAVDALRDAARVGIGIEEAARLLARTGPSALRDTFQRIDRDLRFDGFEAALLTARERVADPGFDTLVAALLMSYRVGGRNLAQVLDGLGRSVRADARARREVQAAQAQNILSARVIAALPLVLLVAIRATNPDYLAVFSTPAGQAILALCLVSVVVGYAGMLRTTQLPVGRRVLR
ncbi:MAG: hypothetical protein C4558_02365 [Dehalococcoidia bacterium]|nr:MAG: hypothetical protein C4558_02365 [Dehalococcoidia bacterium]